MLALDNGDTFHGTFVAGQSRGEAMLPLMNALEFDAMTLHWEFAYGPAQVRKLAAGLTYPALAINICDKVSGQPVFDPNCVIELGGLRIGIIGIASNIVDKGMPPSFSEGVRFALGKTELPGHIDRLRSVDKVDLVVVLSHPTTGSTARSGWAARRSSSRAATARLSAGWLDLMVEGGQVIDVRHQLICVDEQIEPDPEMAQRVAETVAPHRDFLDQVVGRVHSPLDRATSLEASMDNARLDAIAVAAGTRLAFSNGWRYGAPILPGDVTMQHLWNIVPTHPPISTVVRARHPGARQPARQRGGGLTGRTLRGASCATTNRPPRHAHGGHGCVRHPTDPPSSGHYRSVRCPCNGHGTSQPTPMKSALSQRSMHHAKRAKLARGVRT